MFLLLVPQGTTDLPHPYCSLAPHPALNTVSHLPDPFPLKPESTVRARTCLSRNLDAWHHAYHPLGINGRNTLGITKMVLSFRLVTDHQDELIFEVQGVEGTYPQSQRGSAELEKYLRSPNSGDLDLSWRDPGRK